MGLKECLSRAARPFLVAFPLVSIVSCASIDVTKLEISKLEAALYRGDTAVKGGIVPGGVYRLKIKVFSVSREPIDSPDYGGFAIESPNNSLLVTNWDEGFLEVRADYEVLRILESGEYTLSIGVKNNSFQKQTLHWGIDWEGYDRLDYTGKKGRNGDDGCKGRDGGNVPGGGAGIHGEDGENGEDGSPGGCGRDAVLCALFYDVKGLSMKGIDTDLMICLYDTVKGDVMLAPLRKITIDASGGRGGDGGDGGFGGEGDRERAGNNGEPGNGGVGGRGGDGGTVKLYFVDQAVLEYIDPSVHGGPGGDGGDGRFDGSSGQSGKPGEVIRQRIDPEAMKSLLKGVEKAKMDPGRLVF
jgi:hypothetical protein